jgi:hypothetical protein
MTHSLHRRGSSDSLKNDYVFLSTPAIGFNEAGAAPRFERILEVVYEAEPTNIGSYDTGTVLAGATYEDIREELKDTARIRCVFSDLESVRTVLKKLKEEELGISIVISGLIEELLKVAREVGLCPHTANLSLGIHGRTDRLPSETALQFMTMCGHGMVSAELVEELIEDVKTGRYSPQQAAERMGRPCVCGIFNQHRAEQLLTELANDSS